MAAAQAQMPNMPRRLPKPFLPEMDHAAYEAAKAAAQAAQDPYAEKDRALTAHQARALRGAGDNNL